MLKILLTLSIPQILTSIPQILTYKTTGNSNVGFESDLNPKGLHLHERGSSKLAKNLLDFIYCIYKPGTSVSYEPEVSHNSVNKALKYFKTNHPQCVSLGYLNINSVMNKFYCIPPLIEHNIDIFALAETKLDSLFPER